MPSVPVLRFQARGCGHCAGLPDSCETAIYERSTTKSREHLASQQETGIPMPSVCNCETLGAGSDRAGVKAQQSFESRDRIIEMVSLVQASIPMQRGA